ncbi:MAG: hypothetical protein Q8941_16220 [Bacteroidota bacterium]|nr:hypothetical protein [Bacteroidota bacterium]
MKSITLFLLFVVFLTACSPTKKTTSAQGSSSAEITATGGAQDGSSFDKAIFIDKNNEKEGVDAEYVWLRSHYPGYTFIKQSLDSKGNKHYDILKIKTKEGEEKNIYFDISRFFGKL